MKWLSPQEKFWNTWNEVLQRDKQKERLEHSFNDNCAPHYVGVHSFSGTFTCQGKTFICSLDSNFCNCEEHVSEIHAIGNEVPCRYMYRLAYELGIINKDGKLVEKNINKLEEDADRLEIFSKYISQIESYDEQVQKKLRILLRRSSHKRGFDKQYKVFSEDICEVKHLIKDGFFDIVNDSLFLLENQRALVGKMNDAGYEFPEDLERTKQGVIKINAKYEWCLRHPEIAASVAYPDKVVLIVSDEFQKVFEWILEYLSRKFCDTIWRTSSKTVQIPYGAEIIDLYEETFDFPEDIVTVALNYFGHNRCKNYTPSLEIQGSCEIVQSFMYDEQEIREEYGLSDMEINTETIN